MVEVPISSVPQSDGILTLKITSNSTEPATLLLEGATEGTLTVSTSLSSSGGDGLEAKLVLHASLGTLPVATGAAIIPTTAVELTDSKGQLLSEWGEFRRRARR
jgi:hypothetical protein